MFRKSSRSGSGQKKLAPSSRLAHRNHGTADVGSNEPSDRRPSQRLKWNSSSLSLHELQVITYLRKRIWAAVIIRLVLLYHLRCANLTSCGVPEKTTCGLACQICIQLRNSPWVRRFYLFYVCEGTLMICNDATRKNKTTRRSRYGPLIGIGSEVRFSNRDRELAWVGLMPRSVQRQ